MIDIPAGRATGEYPRFTALEYERRWARLDSILDADELDVAIVAGNATSRHELQFLSNAPVRWDSFLVVGRRRPAQLFVQLFNHVPTMAAWSVVPTQWAGTRPMVTIANHLRDTGMADGRLGVLGPWAARSLDELRELVPGATFRSIARPFARMRMVKSAEELAWVERAARACDDAVERACTALEPGLREDAIGHLLEQAYAERGFQTAIAFCAIVPHLGGGAVVPSQAPSDRRLERGDAVVFELSAGVGGYTGQVLRTIVVGGRPSAQMESLHAVADEVYERIVGAIRPGARPAQLEAIGALIDDRGLAIIDDLVHGYVGGYLPPVIRTPATRHAVPPDFALRAGMCLVVQPNVVSADLDFGVQTGGLVIVTEDGAREVHRAPKGLLRAR